MADNENEGSTGSFRQNQNTKRRREPPIIDAKAKDVTRVPSERPAEPFSGVPSSSDPEGMTPPVEAKTSGGEEPVLFGQVLRGSASAASADPASPAANHGVSETPSGASTPSPALAEAPEQQAASDVLAQDGAESAASPERTDKDATTTTFGASPFGETTPPLGADPTSPFVPPPPGRSPATLILGGIAVILLLVIAGLLVAGPPHGGTDDLKAALESANNRLSALEARPDPAPLATQIAQLDQRTGGLDPQITALKAATDDLAKRLNEIAANTAKPAATGAAPADSGAGAGATSPAPADVAALSGRLDDLSRKVDALPSEPTPAVDLGPLQGKVADLAQHVETLDVAVQALPKTDLGPIDKEIADLGNRTSDLDHGLSALAATVAALPKVNLAPLAAGIAATEQRIVPLEAALSVPKAGDRLTEDRAVGSADVARAAPLAVVAQEVNQRIDDGRSLVSDMGALRALGVDDATLAPLSAVAEKGAPTLAGLKTQWDQAEPDVAAAIRPNTGSSLLDKFAAGARQIVSVRRVGAPAGEDPTSIAARISMAIDDGDAATALTEWAKLPEAGRKVSEAWATAARSRLDAQAAAQALESRAIEALAKAKG